MFAEIGRSPQNFVLPNKNAPHLYPGSFCMALHCAGKLWHMFLQRTRVLGFTCAWHVFPEHPASCTCTYTWMCLVVVSWDKTALPVRCWHGTCLQPPPLAVCLYSCVTLQEPCGQTPEGICFWAFSPSTKRDLFGANVGHMLCTML